MGVDGFIAKWLSPHPTMQHETAAGGVRIGGEQRPLAVGSYPGRQCQSCCLGERVYGLCQAGMFDAYNSPLPVSSLSRNMGVSPLD
jgi:hypothetical protein